MLPPVGAIQARIAQSGEHMEFLSDKLKVNSIKQQMQIQHNRSQNKNHLFTLIIIAVNY